MSNLTGPFHHDLDHSKSEILQKLRDAAHAQEFPTQKATALAVEINDLAQNLKSDKKAFQSLADNVCRVAYSALSHQDKTANTRPAGVCINALLELTGALTETLNFLKGVQQDQSKKMRTLFQRKTNYENTIVEHRKKLEQFLGSLGTVKNSGQQTTERARVRNEQPETRRIVQERSTWHDPTTGEEEFRSQRAAGEIPQRKIESMQGGRAEAEYREDQKARAPQTSSNDFNPRQASSENVEPEASWKNLHSRSGNDFGRSHTIPPLHPLDNAFDTRSGSDGASYTHFIENRNVGNSTTTITSNSNNTLSILTIP